MQRRNFILVFTLLPSLAVAQRRPVVKLVALSSGEVRADDRVVDLATLDQLLGKLKQDDGAVWYYRQNASTEPPPQALEAIKLIVKYSLPVSMSTKPDFSDYVDASGNSQTRK